MRKTIKERKINYNCSESNCSGSIDDCGCENEVSNCGNQNGCGTKVSGTRRLMKPSLRKNKSFTTYLETILTSEKRRLFQNTSLDYYENSRTRMSTSENRVHSLSPQIIFGGKLNSSDCHCKESTCHEKDYGGLLDLSTIENDIILSSLLNINYSLTYPSYKKFILDAQNKASKQYLKNGLVQSHQIFLFDSARVIGFNPFSFASDPNNFGCFPCNWPGCCGNSTSSTCYKGCCLLMLPICLEHDLLCWECFVPRLCGENCIPGFG